MKGTSVLAIEHNGRIIEWDVKGFDKTSIKRGDEEFYHVNQFFKYLPAKQVNLLFESLVDIRNAFDSFGAYDKKKRLLTEVVGKFVALLDEEEIMVWILDHSDIPIPQGMKTEYSEQDKDPDKTFLQYEYPGFILLAIVMKILLGVWGEYLKQNRDKLGTIFKEYSALRLLDGTWVMSHQSTIRLIRYIEAWIKQKGKGDVAIVGGVSSYELPLFVLSTIMIRRLVTCSVTENLGNGGIVVNIYRGLDASLNQLTRNFVGLSDKLAYAVDATSQEEKTNYSKLELYMISEPVSSGDIAIHKYFAENVYTLGLQIDNSLPRTLLDNCLDKINLIPDFTVENHSLLLAQWVLSKQIPARMMYNLTKQEVTKLIALTQALLWHWEFFDLALISTADIDRSTLVNRYVQNPNEKRIRTKPMEELSEIYPYQKTTKSKPRDNNLAYHAISSYKESLSNAWLYYYPTPEMEEYASQLSVNGNAYLVPDDLISTLACLLIHLDRI